MKVQEIKELIAEAKIKINEFEQFIKYFQKLNIDGRLDKRHYDDYTDRNIQHCKQRIIDCKCEIIDLTKQLLKK